MEATVVSVGKAVLDGALGYAKSKAAEEIALQHGVERDVNFIRDELQMMQSFLMTADEEQSQNKVLTTWVKQIGVLAYKVEDSLMDFGLHSEKKPFLGCIPRNPVDRRRIAKEVKELRAKVEDVSNRNLRYRLIKESSGSKPILADEQASIAAAAMFATVEHDSSSKVNLHQLVTSNDVNLRVISMWGTSGDLGKTSAIQEVYDDPMVLKRFGFRAWIRLVHPFNPQEFLRSLVRQFYENSHDQVGKAEQATSVGANVLAKMEKMDQSDLVRVFNAQFCSNSYLIVINDLSTIRWGRLMRRWIAEGYARDMLGITAAELCRRYFDELLDRSMILPGEGIDQYKQKISSCQLHDMIREICVSKAREENLIFTLEERCCLSETQGAIRHLVIGSNWKRDKDVLESMLDLSHVRSLTVFGEWRSFFISENMRFVRVLDLEDTLGLRNHHLDQIGQLRHLKYLSLRGCRSILCLPNSFRNLRHLETLDVRGTRISELPTIITNLRKLQHLHAYNRWDRSRFRREDDIVDKYQLHIDRISTCKSCLSRGHVFLRPQVLDAGLNRYDIFNLYRFQETNLDGINLPKGIGKLKTLHALGIVDVSGRNGNATVKEFGELTQLRKLKVGGLSYRNISELWSAIAGHNQLQSLLVEIGDLDEERNELDGCLAEGLLPPSSLESLTLKGRLVNVTKWIHQLQNLSKLDVAFGKLKQDDDAIQALGRLPNLAVLHLRRCSFDGTQLHFPCSSFPSLMVLELCWVNNLQSVLFDKDTMPKLERLHVFGCRALDDISGLPALTSLKEIGLANFYLSETLKESVQSQVAGHMNHVRANIVEYSQEKMLLLSLARVSKAKK